MEDGADTERRAVAPTFFDILMSVVSGPSRRLARGLSRRASELYPLSFAWHRLLPLGWAGVSGKVARSDRRSCA
jgi:hypothetical protein